MVGRRESTPRPNAFHVWLCMLIQYAEMLPSENRTSILTPRVSRTHPRCLPETARRLVQILLSASRV